VNGIATVAALEFRLRLRTGRWRWLLASWLIVLTVIAMLIRLSVRPTVGEEVVGYTGSFMFGGLMLVVLGLALLIAPALAAQSVNGDRERGTLAPLQITGLTSWDLAVGKLLASWGTAVVFLLVTAPLALWCLLEGGLSVGRVLIVYAVMALLIGVVCAVSLGLSAWMARTTTSSVLAYLAVFTLTAGTGVLFGILLAVTSDTVTEGTGEQSYTYNQSRPDRIWWILAPNPFIVLADAAPETPTTTIRLPDGTIIQARQDADLLGALSQAARQLRQPPSVFDVAEPAPEPGPVWPYGLGLQLVLAAGALLLIERRLRTPAGALPTGQRVA
jgi:ABC-type transport system involved in multi-copper enzyme maturation permease subunit